MTAAEDLSFLPTPSLYERTTIDDARHFLRYNHHLVPALKAFYDAHCSPADGDFDTVLSLGEIGGTVIVTRYDDAKSPDDVDAYTVKQYDIQSKITYEWYPENVNEYSGNGDTFERTLLLCNNYESAKLTLSGTGNRWSAESESGLLKSAHLLPYQAEYDIGKTAASLTIVHPV